MQDHVVHRRLEVADVDAEAGAGVALRVEVDDQHPVAEVGQAGPEVHRGGGLADAALLVGDGHDPGQRTRRRAVGLPEIHAGTSADSTGGSGGAGRFARPRRSGPDRASTRRSRRRRRPVAAPKVATATRAGRRRRRPPRSLSRSKMARPRAASSSGGGWGLTDPSSPSLGRGSRTVRDSSSGGPALAPRADPGVTDAALACGSSAPSCFT